MMRTVKPVREHISSKVVLVIVPMLCLFLLLLPKSIVTAQDNYVCQIGNEGYSTLEDAVALVRDLRETATITMVKDCIVSNTIYLADGNVTLDLAGHTVAQDESLNYSMFSISGSGSLRLMDSLTGGVITSGHPTKGIIQVRGGQFIMDGGNLRTTNTTDMNESGVYLVYGGFTMNAGEIKAKYPFRTMAGATGDEVENSVSIHGGRLIATANSIIEADDDAALTVTITGGYFEGKREGNAAFVPTSLAIVNGVRKDILISITGGEFHGEDGAIAWFNNDHGVSCTGESLCKHLIPYGYSIYLADGTFKNSNFTVNEKKVMTANDVVVMATRSQLNFQPSGGVVKQTSAIVTYGTAYGPLPVPTRTGYFFSGWYTSKSGGSKVTANTTVTKAANHTLYAHWKALSAKVAFHANGGKKPSKGSIITTYDKKLGALATVKRSKYLFSGWYTKKSGGLKVGADTIAKFTKATTLYAHWTKVNVAKAGTPTLSTRSKTVKVRIKAVSGAKGYQIWIARNRAFTTGVRKMYVSSGSKTITKLSKGSYYYVRIRAYKYDSVKSKVYGAFSSVRGIKVR